MATRFFFEADATGLSPPQALAPPISPAFDAAWGVTGSAIRRFLTTSANRFGSAMISSPTIAETSSSVVDVLFGQFVSSPLAAGAISGTVKGQMRTLENATDADMRAQLVLWIVKPDGTSRGTLLAADASALSSEFAASLTNRKFPLAASSPATLSSVTAVDGDRLVAEIGYRAHNTTATSKNAQFRYGTAAASDLAEDETSTADDRPWIELSGTLSFSAADEVRMTQEYVESPLAAANPAVRVTQALVEVPTARPVTDPGRVRVTQIFAEVVVEEFWHGFGMVGDDNDDVDYTTANPTGDAASAAEGHGRGTSTAVGS